MNPLPTQRPSSQKTFWHGGPPNLSQIVPANEITLHPNHPRNLGFDYPGDPSLVHVTTDRKFAEVYAGAYSAMNNGGGTVYRVRPLGKLADDPDQEAWPGLAYTCYEAEVLEAAEKDVQFTIERQLYLTRFAQWNDGSPRWTATGHLNLNPSLKAHGITQAFLDLYGPLPNEQELWEAIRHELQRNGMSTAFLGNKADSNFE